ncbi:hypothetical protein N7522_004313 [Penicillium canescens]|uniref:PI-PLC Y-box domain-containing protein n=1 Tax=Penicillium canescens TaxID=5083 RepID=A0AAD6N3R8_PENCN|nr:uncharacterized protein N7446_004206 [Penicillium canescens]KAJ6009297.1 hypothetical protein N7522_004313 [Penicillium canescens]KAJ6027193.1 hypothetical protein N7460_012010 [Penicillium canescens]KAJ6040475.1 hypothetical protein N7444_009380 [Penicillium canescens]KAJ6067169.1 hypothetical protein N7446_004206 [Penicillium canescens]
MLSILACLLAAIGLLLPIHFLIALYHLFLNPLRRFPGPKIDALSQLVWSYHLCKGDSAKYITEQHAKYGEIVRTASNELSFISASAWQEIYGNKSGWDNVYEKNGIAYLQGNEDTTNIFFASSRQHAPVRRMMAPAFSERAVKKQEALVQECLDHMMTSLRKRNGLEHFPREDGVVNMAAWFNFEVFDVLSSLAFGASIGSLESGQYHPWIKVIYGAIKHSTLIQSAHRLKPYHRLLEWLIPQDVGNQYEVHLENCTKTLRARLEKLAPDRHDILSFIHDRMSYEELLDNVNILVTAGGDSTATTLASVVYYITHNTHSYTTLVQEIRDSFENENEITIATVMQLKYLRAVIDESMRVHPSVPVGLPRIVPKSGRFIDGHFVPGGTWVSVTQLTAYRYPKYFKHPEQFIPERWLGDAQFESDNRSVFHPFSIGARNCIGQNLAMSNMCLTLARLLWNFDLESQPDNIDPHESKEYGLWEHRPLNIKLTGVRRA